MARTSFFILAGAVLSGLTHVVAGPVDGTVWQCRSVKYKVDPVSWTDCWSWQCERIAGDGGVATFLAAGNINQNVEGLTLRGIDFTTCATPYFYGLDLTLAGDDAFIDGAAFKSGNAWSVCTPRVELKLKGTGANTLTKKGASRYVMIHPVTEIGSLVLSDGFMTMTNAAGGTFLTEASVALRAGVAEWAPQLAAGESAAATMATGAGAKFLYGTGAGWLSVSKGGGASAALTVGPLVREANGTLAIKAMSGIAALGETEIVRTTQAPEMVNGMVDGSIVARDMSAPSAPYHFLAYDAEKGFVPATYVEGLDGGPNSIARISEDTVLTKDAHVYALVVDNRAHLVISNGVTLTVGDGVHTAAVIFNSQTDVGNEYDVFEGDGRLDFGSSEGVVYHASPLQGRGLRMKTVVTGEKGVSLVSGDGGVDGRFTFFCMDRADVGRWQGETHVSGARLWWSNASAITNRQAIHLHGADRLYSAQLFNSGGTFDRPVHLRGRGPRASDDLGVAYANYGNMVFSDVVELHGECEFNPRDAAVVETFNGPLTGDGGIVASSGMYGTISLNATNTFSGDVVQEGGGTIAVGANGTFGRGAVRQLAANGAIRFDSVGLVVTNALDAKGTVRFNPATKKMTGGNMADGTKAAVASSATLLGPAAIATLELTTAATLGVGTNVVVSSATGATGETVVRGAADESAFTLGGTGGPQDFAAQLADGAGRLSFVKAGTDAVTFHGAKAYTGKTVVRGGTLRLEPDIMKSPDVVYWLDATRPETIFTNESGAVTNWASANGNGVAFCAADHEPAYSATDMAGKPGILFTTTDTEVDYDRLVANKSVQQRTVFIATLEHNRTGNLAGIFGNANVDYGQRYQDGGWRTDVTAYTFITAKSEIGVNGVLGTGRYEREVPYVLTMMHGDDSAKGTGSIFVPCLGGYNGNGRYGGSFGEVIAFNRILDAGERKTVENYLAKKWGVNAGGFHEDVETKPPLSPETDLEVMAPGTFDLNGADVTVASLSGEGRICNSSATKARLTVTGDCSFRGVVEGDVALVRPAAAASDLSVSLEGAATLELAGGTAALSAYVPTPPAKGRIFWMDASKGATVLTDAAGTVTNWRNRADCQVADGFFRVWGAPTYDAAAAGFNGKPAVHFETADNLVSPVDVDTRTLFLVACADGTQNGNWGVFGWHDHDYGFRYTSQTTLNVGTGSGWAYVGDYLRVNGVRHTSLTTGNLTVPKGKPYVLVCRLGDFHQDYAASRRYGRNAINKYVGNGGARQWVAEAVAYDYAMGEEEILSVEKYLLDKWVDNASSEVPAENATIANGTGGLLLTGETVLSGDVALGDGRIVVKVDADGNVATVTVEGRLALGAGATIVIDDYSRAKKGTRHTVLAVTGGVDGTIASSNLEGSAWRLYRRGDAWYLTSADGTAIVFR